MKKIEECRHSTASSSPEFIDPIIPTSTTAGSGVITVRVTWLQHIVAEVLTRIDESEPKDRVSPNRTCAIFTREEDALIVRNWAEGADGARRHNRALSVV